MQLKYLKYIIILFLLSFNHLAMSQSVNESFVELTYTDDRIDLKANNSPLNDVLSAIEDKTGVETQYLIDIDTLPILNVTLSNVTLVQCINNLLKNMNHMIFYDSDNNIEKQKQPKQIWVLGSDNESQELSLVEQPNFLALDDKQRSEMLLHFVNRKTLTDSQLVEALSKSLKTDHNALVRTRAALGLTKLNNEQSVPVLIEALSDESQSVRSQVILALAKVGNDEAVNALGGILNENTDSVERTMAVRALRNLDSEAARHFLDMATNDADIQVRKSVLPDKQPKIKATNTEINGSSTY